jgi:two-component system phosphate regulon sensor histidine kinase PhoR
VRFISDDQLAAANNGLQASAMRIWMQVFGRGVAVMLLGGLIGALLGSVWFGLAAALAAYATWHLYYIYKLVVWLSAGRNHELPEGKALWRYIFDSLLLLQKRERRKKRQLGKIIRRFQKSSAAIPDGLVVFDKQGQISWFNHAASAMLNLSPRHDVGQRISNLVRDPVFVDFIRRAEFSSPVEIDGPDAIVGSRISIQVVAFEASQYLLIGRDVSQLRRLELSRSEFISNASHELRTPLTVIRGYIESLQDDVDELPKHWQTAFRAVDTQSAHMNGLVNDLLTSMKMDSESALAGHEVIAIPDVISRVTEQVRSLIESDIQIVTQIDDSLSIMGNASELHGIISNLVNNASNYMPKHYKSGEGVVTISWQATATGADLSVKDNGAGIAEEHLVHLTDRFYRVDNLPGRYQQGTGLGLSIVAQAVERHGALLNIESAPGVGSQFTVSFPSSRVIGSNIVSLESFKNAG